MLHHDSRTYQQATSDAAAHYRPKFQDWIEGGKTDAMQFLQRLEAETPVDFLVNTGDLGFDIRGGEIYLNNGKEEWTLHRHAVGQMVAKTNILSTAVADKMIEATRDGEPWGRDLLLHNLRTIFQKTDRDRVLLRSIRTPNGLEVRAFLSDKYRRLSCGPILTSFASTGMQEFDAVPIRTDSRFQANYFHDTKLGFSLWLPMIFEPVQNEILLIGMMVQNSDFGNGALTVRMMVIRIWCTNLMITMDELRKGHLGTRLSEDIRFSNETYRLDTETMCSAIKDITRTLFSPARVNGYLDGIRIAAEKKLDDPKRVFEGLRTGGHLLKAEAAEIVKLFNEPEIEMMPPGQTVWRASQAISLFANKTEENGQKERAVELRHVAGMLVDKERKDLAA